MYSQVIIWLQLTVLQQVSSWYFSNIAVFHLNGREQLTPYMGDMMSLQCITMKKPHETYFCHEFIISNDSEHDFHGNVCCDRQRPNTWTGAASNPDLCTTRNEDKYIVTTLTFKLTEEILQPLPWRKDGYQVRCAYHYMAIDAEERARVFDSEHNAIQENPALSASSGLTSGIPLTLYSIDMRMDTRYVKHSHIWLEYVGKHKLKCTSTNSRANQLHIDQRKIWEKEGCVDETWKAFNTSCYKWYATHKVNYWAAHHVCESRNARLVAFNSNAERNWVNSRIAHRSYWLGLEPKGGGVWLWSDGTEIIGSPHWHGNSRSAGKQSCAMANKDNSYKYTAVPCHIAADASDAEHSRVICEADRIEDGLLRSLGKLHFTEDKNDCGMTTTVISHPKNSTMQSKTIRFSGNQVCNTESLWYCSDGGRPVEGHTIAFTQNYYKQNPSVETTYHHGPHNAGFPMYRRTPGPRTTLQPAVKNSEEQPGSTTSPLLQSCALGSCKQGECIELQGRAPICVCNTGFTGNDCGNRRDACWSNPCSDGSVCVNLESGYDFHCLCDANLKGGLFCQRDATVEKCLMNGQSCNAARSRPWFQTAVLDPYYEISKCGDIKGCHIKPCRVGGACYNGIAGFVCICLPGKTGQRCVNDEVEPEEDDDDVDLSVCFPNPCQHGSTCTIDSDGRLKCECSVGWSGATCGNRVDDCKTAEFSCGNGTCVNLFETGAQCKCDAHWTGPQCSQWIGAPDPNPDMREPEFIPVEETNNDTICDSSPCTQNGNCRPDEYGTFTCDCKDGWTGTTCQDSIERCTSESCRGNGQCHVIYDSGIECWCDPQWTGVNCTDRDSHCYKDLCLNGGQCISSAEGAICVCTSEWSGETCGKFKITRSIPLPAGTYSVIYSNADTQITVTSKEYLEGMIKLSHEDCDPPKAGSQSIESIAFKTKDVDGEDQLVNLCGSQSLELDFIASDDLISKREISEDPPNVSLIIAKIKQLIAGQS